MPNFIDISGKKFGMLTVLRVHGKSKDNKYIWSCVCECGNSANIRGSALTRKRNPTISCGCFTNDQTGCNNGNYKHGHSIGGKRTLTMASYSNMIERCYNEKNTAYKYYGGRGIKVCDRWAESFENFLYDMGDAQEGYSIERENVNGNYEKQNCKWIPKNDQAKNTRKNLLVDMGDEVLCLSDACRKLGVIYTTGVSRHRNGYHISDNIKSLPVNPGINQLRKDIEGKQ